MEIMISGVVSYSTHVSALNTHTALYVTLWLGLYEEVWHNSKIRGDLSDIRGVSEEAPDEHDW